MCETSILTYSRDHGLFGGVVTRWLHVCVRTIRLTKSCRHEGVAKTIVLENVVPMPASADELISTLNEHGQIAPKEKTGETSASSQR